MKKLVAIIVCIIPIFSFAGTAESSNSVDSFQELCAKEKDPIKRQNYCHILDKYSQTTITINGTPQEIVTV